MMICGANGIGMRRTTCKPAATLCAFLHWDPNRRLCKHSVHCQRFDLRDLVLGDGLTLSWGFSGFTAGGCKGADEEGRQCCIEWGSNVTVAVKAKAKQGLLTKDVTARVKATVYANLFGWAPLLPLDITCPLCGANCTIPGMSLMGKSLPDMTVALPPCPAEALELDGSTTFSIPVPSVLPFAVQINGTVTVKKRPPRL